MAGADRLGEPIGVRLACTTTLFLAAAMAGGVPAPAAMAASSTPPRQIAPDIVAPPQLDPDELKREQPRAPLSDIGPAGPPKPKKAKAGPNLFKPLAVAAGIIEARGLTVTVAGVDVVGADETCLHEGKDWACGVRARTAFRGFLRGRALFCDLPPGLEEGAVSTRCTIGKLDVGTWLVSNGWARAEAAGPYVEAQEKAKTDGKGIFGAAPDLAGLMPEPAPFDATSGDQPIIAPETAPLEPLPPTGFTPPADPGGLF